MVCGIYTIQIPQIALMLPNNLKQVYLHPKIVFKNT